jgi:hypothetical protein
MWELAGSGKWNSPLPHAEVRGREPSLEARNDHEPGSIRSIKRKREADEQIAELAREAKGLPRERRR